MDLSKITEGADFIKTIIKDVPEVGIILGSGLGELAEKVEDKIIIKYSDVPNMPMSTVAGHAGQFVFGTLIGKKVIMMQGRFHFYEGNKMEDVALPVYVMKKIGIKSLIVTNAAGAVNKSFKPGDLMIINDHINLAGSNPLIGKNDDNIGPRFPDMSEAYDRKLIALAKECGREQGVDLVEGVYMMMSGPMYETPAEIRMARILGSDAIGMSTVPEVIAASHCGIKVLGLSCITNMACGILDRPLNHKEVIETSDMVKDKFIRLVQNIVSKL